MYGMNWRYGRDVRGELEVYGRDVQDELEVWERCTG